jgi:RNA polymerase sigma factor (sigma-70 family)
MVMIVDLLEVRSIVRSETKRTGVPVRDEDLEQDASLKAVEAFRRECEVRYPRAFLRKVVGDAVRDHWRRRREAAERLDAVDEARVAVSPRFEEKLDRRRRVDLLRRGLAELDAVKRATMEAYYVEEWSVAEIAQRQGKSVSAVKMELLRTRKQLVEIVRGLEEEERRKRMLRGIS